MEKIRIAILFGGVSSEHEVSRMSAASVLENLSPEKFEIYPVGIQRDGRWYYYEGDYSLIPDGDWEDEPLRPCMLAPDRSYGGLYLPEEGKTLPIDVVFPVLHGKNGEDGTVQGLLALSGIPCVGSGVLGSAVCMDKVVTNLLLDSFGIPQARYLWFYASDYKKDPEGYERKVAQTLGYPVFVKPANAGSSVGVSKVKEPLTFPVAVAVAGREDAKILVEEAIDGFEVECAVLGNDQPVASAVGGIQPCNEFYDYSAKYLDEASELQIPANLPPAVAETIRETAARAYRLLGCEGLARVDFFVRKSDNAVLLNELNTMPGFTSISMYPKLFEYSGIPYPALLEKLVDLALEKRSKR